MQITIIGAGPGISNAVARLFGSKGFKVALVSRNEQNLRAETEELKAKGIEAMYAAGDAGNERSLNTALDIITAAYGLPDVVLYNAYAPVFKSLENETWESLRQQLDVNVGGAFHVLKRLLPVYKQRNSGRLFFTGGGLALHPQPAVTGLSMGKAALRNLVQGTALGLTGTNVHVATVTVTGYVKEDDPKHNPDAVAAEFWRLYEQELAEFEAEVVY